MSKQGPSYNTRGKSKQIQNENSKQLQQKAEIKKMVAEGIEEALPKILKAMKEDKLKNKVAESKNYHHKENHSSNGDNSNSDSEKGAVAALRWLEKTESVISIIKCADEDMVLYASNLFKDEALEWWNSIVQAMGRHKAYAMEWEEFKEMVIQKFCPINERERIETKFLNLRMEGTKHQEYISKMFEYARLVPHLSTPEPNLIKRYIWGLAEEIRDMVKATMPQTIASAVQLGAILTDGMIRKQEEGKAREVAKMATENWKNNSPWKGRSQLAKGGFNFSVPECKICKKRHTRECFFKKV
ncbi:hypothetical protein L1987_18587 [Smallanthus sonchifolius]|uniref:Uncharacterized protein n=1 Tax=Smallanthus sonchifolius TaxID=185202 RepID=A0ACB9J3L9_9ASTR|nr:hypothetical protein L1987_18587 [Smallanthus sonchifolius]